MRPPGVVLATLAVLAPIAAAAKDQPVRARVIAIVQAKLPTAKIMPTDPQGFDLQLPGREAQQISVARVADFCSVNDAASCDGQVSTFADSVVSLATTDFTVTRARLRVVVRGKPDTDGYLATIADPAKRPLTRPLFQGVSAVLAADFPKGTRMVTGEDLHDLKLGADQAFDLGTIQVLADLPPVPKLPEIDGKVILIDGYDYGASVMLQPDRWRALNEASGGRLYVAIPGDDEVVVGTTKTADDLLKLRELINQEYARSPRGISSLVYRWSPAGWVPAK
jgi:hypothetical protein